MTTPGSNTTTDPSATSGSNVTTGSTTVTGTTGAGTTGNTATAGSGTQPPAVTEMHDMSGHDADFQALQNATGSEFNTTFVSKMLAMHEAKLAELQSASATVTDPALQSSINKAIPKIKMHRDMLSKLSNGNGNNQNGQ